MGLATVIWSYPRGGWREQGRLKRRLMCAPYAAHMAALLGAHIIKVKPPTSVLGDAESKKVYENEKIKIGTLAERIHNVTQACL